MQSATAFPSAPMVMKKMLGFALAVVAVLVIVPLALVAFGTRSAPPPMASISEPFASADFSGLPRVRTLPARDGTGLAYRVYDGNSDQVVLALHGSSTDGRSLHPLAEALQRRGISVYVPDIRGHGRSGRRGDVAYLGQPEDDISDFIAHIGKSRPEAAITLLGFSSGGGLALRYAGSGDAEEPARLVLISPMLGIDSPPYTDPNPNAGEAAWARAFVPRIIGLSILNVLGIHAFDGLPVIAFAVDPDNADATPRYSHRLLASMNPKDYRALLERVPCPITLLAGSRDEVFTSASYAPAVHAVRPQADVRLVEGVGHVGMTLEPKALEAIVRAVGHKSG